MAQRWWQAWKYFVNYHWRWIDSVRLFCFSLNLGVGLAQFFPPVHWRDAVIGVLNLAVAGISARMLIRRMWEAQPWPPQKVLEQAAIARAALVQMPATRQVHEMLAFVAFGEMLALEALHDRSADGKASGDPGGVADVPH